MILGLLAGSMFLKLGDLALWFQDDAPKLITRAFAERAPRTTAALGAGAALGLAGCLVQGTVRNPLAEPGILGITAGAGLGAAIVVTAFGGSRSLLVIFAVIAGLTTFAAITALAWRRGFSPERFVLIGIGEATHSLAVTTYLLLSINSWETPRIYTWLSWLYLWPSVRDVLPVLVVLTLALPVVLLMGRKLDLLAIDEDLPRVLGIRTARTRLASLSIAALLAALSVVAVGVVGFVGLIAPDLARSMVVFPPPPSDPGVHGFRSTTRLSGRYPGPYRDRAARTDSRRPDRFLTRCPVLHLAAVPVTRLVCNRGSQPASHPPNQRLPWHSALTPYTKIQNFDPEHHPAQLRHLGPTSGPWERGIAAANARLLTIQSAGATVFGGATG